MLTESIEIHRPGFSLMKLYQSEEYLNFSEVALVNVSPKRAKYSVKLIILYLTTNLILRNEETFSSI